MGRRKYSNSPILEELNEFSIRSIILMLKEFISKRESDPRHRFQSFNEVLQIETTNDEKILRVRYSFQSGFVNCRVEVVSCPYGSSRFYFLCDTSHKRVMKLYLDKNGHYVSRHLLGAVYRTQKEHKGKFFEISRAGDLRQKSKKYAELGRVKLCNKYLMRAWYIEKTYYSESLEYFTKRVTKMKNHI